LCIHLSADIEVSLGNLEIFSFFEEEREVNAESSMEAYTLTYVKQTASGTWLHDSRNSNWGSAITKRCGKAWEVGGRFKREGTCVNL